MQTGESLLGIQPNVPLSLWPEGEEGYWGQGDSEPSPPPSSLSEVIASTPTRSHALEGRAPQAMPRSPQDLIARFLPISSPMHYSVPFYRQGPQLHTSISLLFLCPNVADMLQNVNAIPGLTRWGL